MPRPAQTTRYLLLRKTPFRETSLVVSGISPDFGRIDFVMKGARAVGRRHFPEAELFREFTVLFREAKNSATLAALLNCELTAFHDAVSERPANYLAACSCGEFFLRNTRPMLAVPESFQAFQILLTRLEKETSPEPWRSLARFAFLHENGFIPADPETENSPGVIEKLLALSRDPARKISADRTGYWRRFQEWIDSLCVFHGLEK